MGQEAVGHWLFTQHSVVAMPSKTETLTKSSSCSVFVQDLLSPFYIKGGQADCSQWVTIRPTPLAVHVNMHVVLYIHVTYDSLNSVLTSLSIFVSVSLPTVINCHASMCIDSLSLWTAQGSVVLKAVGFLRQDWATAVVLSWST